MTKLVRIYELRVKEEIVPEFTDYIETHHYNVQDTHVLVRGEQPWLMDVARTHTKIQEFDEWKIPEYCRQYKYGNPVDDIKVDKTYIAIDETLEELLSIKHSAEINTLKIKLTNCEYKLGDALVRCSDHEVRLLKFNNLPWYKRLWKGFKKEVNNVN